MLIWEIFLVVASLLVERQHSTLWKPFVQTEGEKTESTRLLWANRSRQNQNHFFPLHKLALEDDYNTIQSNYWKYALTSEPSKRTNWNRFHGRRGNIDHRTVVYKSRGLCAIFQLFGAASIQVWLLFEGGSYEKCWVCKTGKSSLARVKRKWAFIAIVRKLFQM